MAVSKAQWPTLVLQLKMTAAPRPWKSSSRWAELRAQKLVLVSIILAVVGVGNEAYVNELTNSDGTIAATKSRISRTEAERALKRLASFRECAKECPKMIVVRAGGFRMGSPATEKGRYVDEGPECRVVSKFPVTFADWEGCVSVGGCPEASQANDDRIVSIPDHRGERPHALGKLDRHVVLNWQICLSLWTQMAPRQRIHGWPIVMR